MRRFLGKVVVLALPLLVVSTVKAGGPINPGHFPGKGPVIGWSGNGGIKVNPVAHPVGHSPLNKIAIHPQHQPNKVVVSPGLKKVGPSTVLAAKGLMKLNLGKPLPMHKDYHLKHGTRFSHG